MALSAVELWRGTNGDAWPVGTWHNPVLYPGMASASTIDIQSNVGRLLPSTANATVMGGVFLRHAPVQDFDVSLTVDHASATTAFFILSLRATLDLDVNARPTNSVNMVCSLGGDTIQVDKEIAGANTALSSAVAFVQTNGTPFSLRFRVVGPSIKAKWWTASGNEPSAWNYETNDGSTVFPGYVGLQYLADSGGNSAKFTNFSFTDLTPAPPLILRRLKAPRRPPIKAAALVANPAPSEDDPATAADAGESIAAALTDADTGAGADAGESLAVALTTTETAAGADAGESITVAVSDSDTGAAADAGESIAAAISDAESGAGADAGGSVAVALTDTETGAGADAGESLAAALSDAESAAAIDAGESIVDSTTVSDSDTGTGTDAGESITVAVSDSDTGAGVDAEAVSVATTDTDTGMSLDLELELLVALTDAEAAIAAEAGTVDVGGSPDDYPITLTYTETNSVAYRELSTVTHTEESTVTVLERPVVTLVEESTTTYREKP